MSNLDNINYPAPKQEYKVLVRCFTFNHSKYIEDALNGFAMQQTNFPFVCLVVDDASTDGEQDVIKAWMERECDMSRAETIDIPTSVVIIVPLKTNVSCTFAFYLLKKNLYGTGDKKMNHIYPWRDKCEYEALCEGDDYWIDPLKLQKQVDFLDGSPEYVMTYTKCHRFIQSRNEFEKEQWGGNNQFFEEFLTQNTVPTLTSVCRITALKQYYKEINPISHNWKMGDYPLWLYLSHEYKIKYIDTVTGVYRILSDSASHFKTKEEYLNFIKSSSDIVDFFIEYFDYKFDKDAYKRMRLSRLATNLVFLYEDFNGAKTIIKSIDNKSFVDYIKLIFFSNPYLFKLYKYFLKR